MALNIRTATLEDRPAIIDLVRDAFGTGDRDGEEEVDIVMVTWSKDASPPGLELVAVEHDAVVGHVLAARGDLDGREVVAVAPLGVRPNRQGVGIGTALMTELIERADAAGLPMLLLLGNPAYYSRFGFERAAPLGITYPPVGHDSPHFQVRRLATYDASYRGLFAYCWEGADPAPD